MITIAGINYMNCTGHEIVIHANEQLYTLRADTCVLARKDLRPIVGDVTWRWEYRLVGDIPEPVERTRLIVDTDVVRALPWRNDLVTLCPSANGRWLLHQAEPRLRVQQAWDLIFRAIDSGTADWPASESDMAEARKYGLIWDQPCTKCGELVPAPYPTRMTMCDTCACEEAAHYERVLNCEVEGMV
jgi:hypothetical protein